MEEIKRSWTFKNAAWFVADDIAIIEAQIAYAEKQRNVLVKLRGDNGETSQAAVRRIDNDLLRKPVAPPVLNDEPDKKKKTSELDAFLAKKQRSDIDDYYRYSSEEELQTAITKNAELSARATVKATAEVKSLREKYIDLIDPLQRYRDQLIEIERLKNIGEENGGLTLDEATQAMDKVNVAMDEARDKMFGFKETGKTVFSDLQQAVDGWGKAASNAFANFAISGKASFSDLMRHIALEATSMAVYETAFKPLFGAFGNFIKNINIPLIAAPGHHDGGIVGSEPSFMRNVSPEIFLNAPRFHMGGIVGDEVPAILKRGEGVFTPEQMRNLGSAGDVNVTVINSGTAQQVKSKTISVDSRGKRSLVLELEDAMANGVTQSGRSLGRSIGASFGLSRALIPR